jgi:hypothetical protein
LAGDPSQLNVGQLRRQIMLGSEAVYRVTAVGPALAELRVVQAPGLAVDRKFVFSRDAVLAMELLGETDGRPPPGAKA